MENLEIKKVLYKERPTANLKYIGGGSAWYESNTSLGLVSFNIPISDMGDNKFNAVEPAQLLIRWIV
jgi:hypothetical protein